MTASAGGAGGGAAGVGTTAPRESVRHLALRTLSTAGQALAQLASGLNTAVLAGLLTLWLAVTAATSVVGVGLLTAPAFLRALHALAGRERARLARTGPEVVAPQPPPTRLRLALADTTTHRELRWLLRHFALGLPLGLIGVLLPVLAVRDTAFPLYWKLMPEGATATSVGVGNAHGWPDALAVALLGVGWIAIILGLTPGMARLQSAPGRRLLSAGPDTDLSLRVAELTATRAAALDAHATELRRIERSLHDGAQNRLVSVAVLIGASRRMVARDPAGADELLERAQSAAEQALAELRTVARGILPPVLADRGLAGALSGLAADCAVPCRIDVDVPGRCAASVEATAYFVVAEALTNIAKHSGARHAVVTARGGAGRLLLSIEDDGRGGAGGTSRAADSGGSDAGSGDTGGGSGRADAGSGGADAGSGGPDAGSGGADASSEGAGGGSGRADAGSGGADAGSGGADAGSGGANAGSGGPDAGSGGPDSGSGRANAGSAGAGGSSAGADSGSGGAGGGSGLTGIRRRVAAHDGTLTLTSPPGGPTVLTVDLPCGS